MLSRHLKEFFSCTRKKVMNYISFYTTLPNGIVQNRQKKYSLPVQNTFEYFKDSLSYIVMWCLCTLFLFGIVKYNGWMPMELFFNTFVWICLSEYWNWNWNWKLNSVVQFNWKCLRPDFYFSKKGFCYFLYYVPEMLRRRVN